jgi:glycosyltransferase involved in cell wall biosynthesis
MSSSAKCDRSPSASLKSGDCDRRLQRVLYVLGVDPAKKFGSLEEQTLTIARVFRDRGSLFLPVFMACLDIETAAQYESEGLPVEVLDLTRFRFGILRRLVQVVRRNRIEIVHWNFYDPLINVFPWYLSVLSPRIRHYFTDHSSRLVALGGDRDSVNLKTIVQLPLALRYRKILCISDYVFTQLNKRHRPHLERISYFVNTERFRPDPAAGRKQREVLGQGPGFVALVVAYLVKGKGVDVALRALAEAPEEIVLWIIGDGPEQASLQSMARDLNLGKRVRFLGAQRRVEPFMQAADCIICPSVWGEAVGLVNLEGMACGVPIVASRVGGIPEFVEDAQTGYLFTPGDHHELADRLARLLRDEHGRRRLGQNGRAVGVERYSAKSQLDKCLSLYRAESASAPDNDST